MKRAIETKKHIDFLKGASNKEVLKRLPRLDEFYTFLKTQNNQTSDMKFALWGAMGDRLNKAYNSNWEVYMAMTRLPSQGMHGIMYNYAKDHSFKESIKWILHPEKVELLGPAATYNRWRDVEENNPKKIFHKMEDILNYPKFGGLSFLRLPKVKINGEIDSLSIQNWFGDNTKILTGKKIRNPYYDC